MACRRFVIAELGLRLSLFVLFSGIVCYVAEKSDPRNHMTRHEPSHAQRNAASSNFPSISNERHRSIVWGDAGICPRSRHSAAITREDGNPPGEGDECSAEASH